MARELYFCTECGWESHKWLGRCPGCGAWNSFAVAPAPSKKSRSVRRGTRQVAPVAITEAAAAVQVRVPIGIGGVDRVLGGGLVAGSIVLLAGAPGIGKSTLMLQLAGRLAAAGSPVLYVSGEESAQQVAMRARRLGVERPEVLLLPETSCAAVLHQLEGLHPAAVIVDSIQTMLVDEVDAPAGSIGQVRQAAARFQELAKTTDIPVVLAGHVTKDGLIAGPKLLEHLVDVVLSMEGEPAHDLRVLRASKNRFGTVAELALFSMTDHGLDEVHNPSAWLLDDRQAGAPGSAVAVAIEGRSPLLVEVQALVTPSRLGTPRRVAQGFDPSRLALLLAVAERNTGAAFGDRDVFVNIVGGLSLREPALDLAVTAALLSSVANRPLPEDLAIFGEIGLLGEVRAVSRAEDRLHEAAAMGFARVAMPARQGDAGTGSAVMRIARVADLASLLRSAEPLPGEDPRVRDRD